MSKETRRDFVLIVILSLMSAMGMTSVFWGCRFLAWITIVVSDLYLLIVLLLAALRAEDDTFLNRHSWITHFLPRKTAGILVVTLLFLTIISGFAGLYVGDQVFASSKTPLECALHQLVHSRIYRLLPKAWLRSICSDRSTY